MFQRVTKMFAEEGDEDGGGALADLGKPLPPKVRRLSGLPDDVVVAIPQGYEQHLPRSRRK